MGVHCLTALPDGTLVSGSADCTMRLWNVNYFQWQCIETLRGHIGSVCAVAVMSGGSVLVSASLDSTLKVWHNKICVQTISCGTHHRHACCLAVASDGILIASYSDGRVSVWQ